MSATAYVMPVPFLYAAVAQGRHHLALIHGDTAPPVVREDCQGPDLRPSSNTHLFVPANLYTLEIPVGVAANAGPDMTTMQFILQM